MYIQRHSAAPVGMDFLAVPIRSLKMPHSSRYCRPPSHLLTSSLIFLQTSWPKGQSGHLHEPYLDEDKLNVANVLLPYLLTFMVEVFFFFFKSEFPPNILLVPYAGGCGGISNQMKVLRCVYLLNGQVKKITIHLFILGHNFHVVTFHKSELPGPIQGTWSYPLKPRFSLSAPLPSKPLVRLVPGWPRSSNEW